MKSLDKNITDQNRIAAFMVVQSMQARMTSAALQNGMSLSTTIGLDDKNVPYLGYAVKYHGEERAVFSGQARLPKDPHYSFIMQALHGEVVSEICPPALRETKVGENTEVISFWKRSMTLEHDITLTDHSPRESTADPLDKVRRISAWVGYNGKGVEILRVQEGAANPGHEKIERIQFVDMGPRGVVVAVIFKDAVYKPGEEKSLGESIKDVERQRMSMQAETATSVGAIAPATSFSDRFSDAGLSSISGTRSSLSASAERLAKVEAEITGNGNTEVMVAGMRAVLPKVLTEVEFQQLNGEAKTQYLVHVDGIAKLFASGGFSLREEDPKAFESLKKFLTEVLTSGILRNVYRSEYIRKSLADNQLHSLEFYTSNILRLPAELFAELFGSKEEAHSLYFMSEEGVKQLKYREPPIYKESISILDLANDLLVAVSTVANALKKIIDRDFKAGDLLNVAEANAVVKALKPNLEEFLDQMSAIGGTKKEELPKVLTKAEYDALSPEDQRKYYDSIQKVIWEVSKIWNGSKPGQVSEAEMKFLKDALYSDVFSHGWDNFIKKAAPERRYTKTYYAAQALGLTDDFLQNLIGMFVKFEEQDDTQHLLSTPANAAHLEKSIGQAKAGQTRARKLIDPTKKPAAKKAATVKATAKTAARKAPASKTSKTATKK